MVQYQTEEYIQQQRSCPECSKTRSQKGQHEIVYSSLFGKLKLHSPRLYTCSCQPQSQGSFSPLAECLPERIAPELLYLETKWASLMSYGLTVNLIEEVLPINTNVATVYRQMHQAAERTESELGDEHLSFIDSCMREWESLPEPDPPLTVGIDGCYIHGREGDNRKAGWFEVIVGKSITEQGENKRFAFVHDYDEKPKRRLSELLKAQGLQLNQTVTFLSDGGDTVRDLQFYHTPFSEHVLDWFHITMRITVITQMAKGLPQKKEYKDIETNLERLKWYLWNGNVFQALQLIDRLVIDLEIFKDEDSSVRKLWSTASEFQTYINNNGGFIPNYRDRYFYGEAISTGFVESTVNQVVSKRMVKKQQMRWTKKFVCSDDLSIRGITSSDRLSKTANKEGGTFITSSENAGIE